MFMKKYLRQTLIALPICFCVGVGIMCLIPKYYTSSFVIARESEEAVETNRAITLNQPNEYDLGIARTDNAITVNGYAEILKSDAFLYALLGEEVSTLDKTWHGTLGAFLNHDKKVDISYDSISGWYSKDAVETMRTLRKSIQSKIDYETRFVTVSCTANDPMVATQLARLVNKALLTKIDQYEHDKMADVLSQLQARTSEAEKAFEAARAQGALNQETLGEIAHSFGRQQVVYEAQMIHHPAYLTLLEPSVEYRKAGPSRWQLPLLLTLLLGAGMIGWNKREILKQYF